MHPKRFGFALIVAQLLICQIAFADNGDSDIEPWDEKGVLKVGSYDVSWSEAARKSSILLPDLRGDVRSAARIRLKNDTSRTIDIKTVHSACGCVVGHRTDKNFDPGDTTDVWIVIRPTPGAQAFDRKITLIPKNPEQPAFNLMMKAKVLDALVVDKPRVIVHPAAKGAGGKRDGTIITFRTQIPSVDLQQSKLTFIGVNCECKSTLIEKTTDLIRVKLDLEPTERRSRHGTVLIRAASVPHKSAKIEREIQVEFRDPIRIRPSRLILRRDGQTLEGRLAIQHYLPNGLDISNVKARFTSVNDEETSVPVVIKTLSKSASAFVISVSVNDVKAVALKNKEVVMEFQSPSIQLSEKKIPVVW